MRGTPSVQTVRSAPGGLSRFKHPRTKPSSAKALITVCLTLWITHSMSPLFKRQPAGILEISHFNHGLQNHCRRWNEKMLLLGQKVMTNLDSILKAETSLCQPRSIHIVKAMVFSSSLVWMWELDHTEGWASNNWCFWNVVLEKTLESPLDCKEIQPVHPKGNQFWIFIGRTAAEVEAPILWPPDAKSWPIWKDPDAGKDLKQEKKGMTEDEMVGWHYQQAVGDGERPGSLPCCSQWGCKESDTPKWLNKFIEKQSPSSAQDLTISQVASYPVWAKLHYSFLRLWGIIENHIYKIFIWKFLDIYLHIKYLELFSSKCHKFQIYPVLVIRKII